MFFCRFLAGKPLIEKPQTQFLKTRPLRVAFVIEQMPLFRVYAKNYSLLVFSHLRLL